MLRLLLLLLSSLTLWADAHIFVYHRFDDSRYPSTNTSLEELYQHLSYLHKNGFQVITLSKLINALQKGDPINEKWVVLTIDDGFRSFLKALPIFRAFNFPFTLFISTKAIEHRYPDYLRWSELRKITQFGEIALHSHSHPHLTDLSDKAILHDTTKAIALFRHRLGFSPKFYAFPYGEYSPRIQKLLRPLFYALLSQDRGAIAPSSSLFALARIPMVGKSDIAQALKIKHLQAHWIKPTHYHSILRHIQVQIDPRYKSAWLYVTGYGWQKVDVHNGLIDEKREFSLTKRRVRVIIKVKHSKISTKLLVRSEYGAE